ncbi:PQQ-dependent sugar dehydrogenase [Tamlana sp. 2_MG-2023]|uniref:PQQ-dependent sugar dehydrogenase n=1 Tax=unclassified Tamlana TaxID=2614803 RepID=UPI0026E16266|nr:MULTISPECIES: PQQ-dependent sugar dehydrogenase [unclassified Tamlana]MDO6760411.1 PQQ-dependent sugar dehydrogenase [Tamlana sp. 2_MG-2023]MDO6789890.1 PQQ-dependent sugar dehydrogenase [Tamlana sp. 1_MG-2023]
MKKIYISLFIILTTLSACSQQKESIAATSANYNYKTELVVPDLDIPWGMAFLPDGSILITEKSGELILFKDGNKHTISGLPDVYVRGQGGLLDIALHPNYEETGWIYFTYASAEGEDKGGNTAIMRARLDQTALVDNELLYKAEPNTRSGNHWGSRITFDNNGYLYFSIGDRYSRDVNPQDITRDCGKIYRLHDDGSIPKDNPFVDTKNAKKAIFSYGHRNPQGLIKNPNTGKIWAHEHGPQGGDEINIIEIGKNYGWPVISYGVNYGGTTLTELTHKEGMEQPFFYWTPSIAPSGMAYVTSDKYPEWQNNLLVGALKFQYLEHLIIKNNKVVKREKLFENIGRLRNVVQAPDGYIYIAVEGKGIYKIVAKTK